MGCEDDPLSRTGWADSRRARGSTRDAFTTRSIPSAMFSYPMFRHRTGLCPNDATSLMLGLTHGGGHVNGPRLVTGPHNRAEVAAHVPDHAPRGGAGMRSRSRSPHPYVRGSRPRLRFPGADIHRLGHSGTSCQLRAGNPRNYAGKWPFPGVGRTPPAYRFSLCGGGYNASRLNDREGVEHIPYYAYRLRTTEGSDIERENVRGGWDR